MSYTFNNLREYKNFIEESLVRGDYTRDLENFKRGINTVRIEDPPTTNWDWLEQGKLYLVNNSIAPSHEHHFIIYRLSPKQLWFYNVYGGNHSIYEIKADEREMWVRNYFELKPHEFNWMNWMNENPLEVKE